MNLDRTFEGIEPLLQFIIVHIGKEAAMAPNTIPDWSRDFIGCWLGEWYQAITRTNLSF